ncbi:lipopolysaccharide biosynthesis protein [Dyella flagellata]|uniref:Succinoglycan biosynthesis transporter n=1 Tax=Dyella flagellata TaxID=1867833 RepID=A0ABQ5XED8_9GAMM|nr:polysaccharide biosynthesis C-terminal domain-containing protein [Dyella flagellata]GLQ89887.1 succinoglycan biosynthesis transporter [Dyella flagellata]
MNSSTSDISLVGRIPQSWRHALGAISVLWIATALGAVMAFFTQALLARKLGPAEFGLFASSLATITMVAPLAAFGLPPYWLQLYGVEGWQANRWLRPSLRFITGSTLLSLSLVVAWSFIGAPPDAHSILLLLLPVVLGILASSLISSQLRLEERHYALALWQLMTPGSRMLVAVLLMLVPALDSRAAAVGFSLISLVVAMLALPRLRAMMQGGIRLHGHGPRPVDLSWDESPSVARLWSQAWAYGMEATLYPIFFQISTVLLKYLDGNAQAGIFGIALGVMMAIYLIPTTVYQKFLLSKLHRWAAHDLKKFWTIYRLGSIAMFASGVVVGAVLIGVSPWLVPIIFGEKFRPVVKVLAVLAVCVPIRFLSTATASALLNEKHMRYRVLAMGTSAVIVIVSNVLLIPIYHVMGAAAATVIGETSLLLMMYLGMRHFHVRRTA